MRRGAGAVIGLTAGALLLAAWVTSAGPTEYFGDIEASSGEAFRPAEPEPDESPEARDPVDSEPSALPRAVVVVITVLLLLFAAALLYLIVGRGWKKLRTRRRSSEVVPLDDIPVDQAEAMLPLQLSSAVERSLADIGAGSPRNAIVRCWLSLEGAVASAGMRRDPAFTSTEFTRQVLARHAVDAGEIHTLAELYREARFSQHDMTEPDRETAETALRDLQSQLAARGAEA